MVGKAVGILRGLFFLLFALLIDGAQFFATWIFFYLGLGLQVITPVGGGVGGAAAGAYFCWDTSQGIWTVITNSAACAAGGGTLGALLSAYGLPMGIGLGVAFCIIISLTFGTLLILMLSISGMFYPGRFMLAYVGETIPGIDMFPCWTALVCSCLLKKRAKRGGLVGVAAGLAAGAPVAAVVGEGRSVLRAMDGIRVANDNVPQESYEAAA